MKSKSVDYIQLQNIYKTKARKDVAEIVSAVKLLESQLGRATNVEHKEVEAFCKSAGYVTLVRGRPPHISRPNDLVQWKDRAKFAGMCGCVYKLPMLVPLWNKYSCRNQENR